MLDEVARWDDLVAGLRPMTYGARGEPALCLVSIGPTTTTKASSEGWRLRLRPNSDSSLPLVPDSLDGAFPWLVALSPVSISLLAEPPDITSSC
jgi:hypothetical protein